MNTDSLELRQLRALVALAEEGTFTDAAIRVTTSQPAVSRMIARLEQAVGVRLVDRTTRTVALTAAGEAFYRSAAATLRMLDDAVGAARGQTRPLRLGYSWAAFGRHTSAIQRAWRAEHPDVALEVHRIEARAAGLARGEVDVAVIRGEIDHRTLRELRIDPAVDRVIAHESRLAALPIGHRLSHRESIEITELVDDPIAITAMVGTTTLSLWPADAQPPGVLSVDNIDEWLDAIAAGDAVGVTPASTPHHHARSGVVFVPVRGVPPVAVHLVWPHAAAHPRVEELAALALVHLSGGGYSPAPDTVTRVRSNDGKRPTKGPSTRANRPTSEPTIEVQSRLE